jgi:protein-disulfide isomerase-like protein with CxxC motif
MDDIPKTRELLNQQLTDAIEADPLAALPLINAVNEDAARHLRDAVRDASTTASWSEIGDALGVSKQAAHQRFRELAKGLAADIKAEHRVMKSAQRRGDHTLAAESKARRDDLASELRRVADNVKVRV